MCNPYTYLSVPVWRTYNTCVLWSAISNMNQWITSGFRTGIMILYVYKIQKKKKHKSLDICCTLNGLFILKLCIYWFGVLRGYKVQKWTFLCVCESVSKVSTATTGSSGYKQMKKYTTHHPTDCGCSFTRHTVPRQTMFLSGSVNMNCGLKGETAPSIIQHNMKTAVRLETALISWPRISSHPLNMSSHSNSWPQNSDKSPLYPQLGWDL